MGTFIALLQALSTLSLLSHRPFYDELSYFVAGKNAEWRNLVVKKCDSIFSERERTVTTRFRNGAFLVSER